MKLAEGQFERPPIDLLLGALNMVALPLVRGEDGAEMSEVAQFYGFEDWGDHFRNVSPRISELVAHRPRADQLGCLIELKTQRVVLPGAFHRAAARWTRAMRMAPASRNVWRGAGMVLRLEVSAYFSRERRVRAHLTREP